MSYRVNVNECYYGVSNDKLISKIIKADNVNNLIDKFNVDNDTELASKFGIRSVPTLVLV